IKYLSTYLLFRQQIFHVTVQPFEVAGRLRSSNLEWSCRYCSDSYQHYCHGDQYPTGQKK
ncbi:MAG: hypothetical protein NC417_14285, partial [Candidatus Gastranaerophilales bacterium]|nr:hypothetical protein [Candidatus Gastranaerophilales bacterium]